MDTVIPCHARSATTHVKNPFPKSEKDFLSFHKPDNLSQTLGYPILSIYEDVILPVTA
jgi:hypothetical protein